MNSNPAFLTSDRDEVIKMLVDTRRALENVLKRIQGYVDKHFSSPTQ